jgi:hypothetical protein
VTNSVRRLFSVSAPSGAWMQYRETLVIETTIAVKEHTMERKYS